MKRYNVYLSTIILFIFVSCAKIYLAPDAKTIASKHKVIAIAPPQISLQTRKSLEPEILKTIQESESMAYQQEIFNWMLKRKKRGQFTVEIQDPVTTNQKLKQAGYPDKALTPAEMCQVLKVDGIITSHFSIRKPVSEGAALAIGLLFDVWMATNEVVANMSIHDGNSQKMIWNFNHRFSGTVGSTPAQLIHALMRQASRKMPYKN